MNNPFFGALGGGQMRWAQAHGQWVAKSYRPGDVLIYDFPGTSYKTDYCGICESVSGQYVTAIDKIVPDSLTVAWFAAWTAELALLANIKIKGKDE